MRKRRSQRSSQLGTLERHDRFGQQCRSGPQNTVCATRCCRNRVEGRFQSSAELARRGVCHGHRIQCLQVADAFPCEDLQVSIARRSQTSTDGMCSRVLQWTRQGQILPVLFACGECRQKCHQKCHQKSVSAGPTKEERILCIRSARSRFFGFLVGSTRSQRAAPIARQRESTGAALRQDHWRIWSSAVQYHREHSFVDWWCKGSNGGALLQSPVAEVYGHRSSGLGERD
mmetsp:Transcript_5905/g.16638  ORF Transcript_5905/g.16638 Transcript_5905/m.16638 type:complete len:230 (+) Transcript_5905:1125-1814(+)